MTPEEMDKLATAYVDEHQEAVTYGDLQAMTDCFKAGFFCAVRLIRAHNEGLIARAAKDVDNESFENGAEWATEPFDNLHEQA